MSAKKKKKSPEGGHGGPPQRNPEPSSTFYTRLEGWIFGPQPLVRLELLRILLPLAILGFMSSRIWHADHWLSDVGFNLPDLGSDRRQPLYIPAVPAWFAWCTVGVMVVSGLSVVAGLVTRWAVGIFTATLFYVALADRLAAFTVSKLGPLLMLALFFSPCGARYGIDAWRKGDNSKATQVSGGSVRFFQVFLAVFYFSSGMCKAHGDWLIRADVLWTYLHGSYQTVVSYWLANTLPAWAWTVFQWATLIFECGAPLWFALRPTRPVALVFGVTMHLMIGLMFGPVIWFSLLMVALLVACYTPVGWLVAQR